MKKLFITISTLILLFTLTQTVTASPSIIIYDYTLYPEVFMPGDFGILTLTVKNAETTATRASTSDSTTTTTMVGATLNNIWLVAAESEDREISANLNYEDVGYLAPSASIPIHFRLHADSEMPEGFYFPTIRIDVETYTDVNYPVLVQVSNTTVDLLTTNFPAKISRSGGTEITLTIINNRPNTVNSVTINPIQTTDISITPEQHYIGEMTTGLSEDITFILNPTEKGVYNVSFEISYKNGDNLHTTVTKLTTEVIETYDVAPIITSFPISITKGGSAKIRLEVYNAKTEQITGVLITPASNAVVIPTQYFIGSMDSDDVFSASFDIFTNTLDLGTEEIRFLVTYKQGNEYYQAPIVQKNFEIIEGIGTSYQAQSSTATTTTEAPSLTICLSTFVIIIIVIVVIIIFFIRWKKRRKA